MPSELRGRLFQIRRGLLQQAADVIAHSWRHHFGLFGEAIDLSLIHI